MKFSDIFGTVLWNADLLGTHVAHLTIATIEMEYIDDSAEACPVIYFNEDEKGLKLGRRNAAALQEAFGDDMRRSYGQTVVLSAEGTGRYAYVKLSPVIRPTKRPAGKRHAKRKSA